MPDRADKKYPYYVKNKDFYVFDWGFLLESVFVFLIGRTVVRPYEMRCDFTSILNGFNWSVNIHQLNVH